MAVELEDVLYVLDKIKELLESIDSNISTLLENYNINNE